MKKSHSFPSPPWSGPVSVTKLWGKSEEAMGYVSNVFRTRALNNVQFLAWWRYFNLFVSKEGYLSYAEREMVGVVVSGTNGCTYCAVSHAALREASLSDHEIMEVVQVIGMFNMTNRVSGALGLVPNADCHSQART